MVMAAAWAKEQDLLDQNVNGIKKSRKGDIF